MKKSQRDTYTPSEDFEDLTLFANESFDTQDVDLFEFSSEESSPLTRLKSIILSLDWEINDEILQELADEIVNLEPLWQEDKVAEVYLQGLAKIGNYIRTKGAYAHPNSIKLLLTFFYNFEKIISSPDITGDQITQLLKGDVRKFKILQYQITQSEQGEETFQEDLALPPPESDQPVAPALEETPPPTHFLKASILGLDWEVTDESLLQFNRSLATCHQEMTDNKPALVLLQGLQALGDYIADERARSHPDAFSLLHSFNEALERVSAEPPLDDNEMQQLLVDRINQLNNLKMVIVSPESDKVDEAMIAGVVEEITEPTLHPESQDVIGEAEEISLPSPLPREEPAADQPQQEEDTFTLGDELDSIFGMEAKPAMETADEQYPDEILPPDAIHPVDDELADDLIGAQLSSKRGFAPALSDTEEEAGFNAEEATLDLADQSDLAEQLDFLFADTEEAASATENATASDEEPLDIGLQADEPIAALSDVEFSLDEDDEKQQASPEPSALDESMLDIEGKLDSFFTDATEVPGETPSPDATIEESEQSLFVDATTSPTAALADSEENKGFSEEDAVVALGQSPIDEIEQKLDFFFGDELGEDLSPVSTDAAETEDTSGPAPALSGFEEEIEESIPAATATSAGDEKSSELSEALDEFFEAVPESAEPQLAETVELEEDLSAVFTDAAETEDTSGPVPALSGFEEEIEESISAATATSAGDEKSSELSEALDEFFETASESTAPQPVESDALTEELEATLGVVGEQQAPEDIRQIDLAALGAILPSAVRSLDRIKLDEAESMLKALQQKGLSNEHKALAQLLQSVLTMLSRLPAKSETDTEKLVNYLYEQLLVENLEPTVLTVAISRFSHWLQQAGSLMPLVPSAGETEGLEQQEPQFHYTAKELYFELAELRRAMNDEFAKLRHHLKHHH